MRSSLLEKNFKASKKPSGATTLEGFLVSTLKWRQSTGTLRAVGVNSPHALESLAFQ